METEQLHTNGRPLCPTTNYENDNAAQRIRDAELLLEEIADRVANRLLEKADIAEWAKQASKPSYTAAETGADPSGSAQRALLDAKEYSDGTYRQATGYTDTAIARLIGSAPSTLDTLEEIARAMAENDSVVQALEAAVGLKASEAEFQGHAGNKTVHVTASERTGWNNAKTDAASACQRLDGLATEVSGIKTNFQDGCNTIAGKITACGVSTPADASPGTMAANIQKIYNDRYSAGASAARVGNASAAQVLTGRTFTSAGGSGQTGTMANRGAVSQALNCGGSYTIPAGYHSGSGKVTANTLASQTSATAAAAHILKDKTAYVNGTKITGTMINRGAVSQALNCGGSYTIPAGYHSGSGKVTASTLASQTSATAAAGNITKGKTAYVNGVKVTGTGADNTSNYNNGYNAGLAAGAAAGNYNIALTLGVKIYNGRNEFQGESSLKTINIFVRNGQVSTDYKGTGSVEQPETSGSYGAGAGWHMIYIKSLTIARA